MHMLNYKIRDFDKAEQSLARLYNIKLEAEELKFEKPETHVNEHDVRFRVAYAQACKLAKTSDDWIELDYLMSQYPPDVNKLQMFINQRRVTGKEVQQ